MYHYHEISNTNVEHIQNIDNNNNSSLCGFSNKNLSSNGEPITLEWANQNFPMAIVDGLLCKNCAKAAIKILKEKEYQHMN